MSNRPRRRPDVLPAAEALPADHVAAGEAQLILAGEAFEELDARIDQGLEALVSRWVQYAAPSASFVRRIHWPAPSQSQP